MSGEHRITLSWRNGAEPFAYETYPREHRITFKALTVTASASPVYKGDGKSPDPEELLVGALSSCHMLSFLAICAKKRIAVDSYDDEAVGFLENDGGRWWISRVTLRPLVTFAVPQTADVLADLHHKAHEACFIANSVKTAVTVEPR
jgi:organic hydroperoxide reductase OsmC/OhrA